MTTDEQILAALEEIKAIVRVISSPRAKELLDEVAGKSATRRKMFSLFNGRLSLTEIAARTKTTKQSVQSFASDCEQLGLVRLVQLPRGRGKSPVRVF